MTRSCPLCGLRFRWSSELDEHARDDHVRVHVEERSEHITRYPVTGRPVRGAVYPPF